VGLSVPLDQVSFSVNGGEPRLSALDPKLMDSPAHWHFVLREPTPGHQLAIAVRRLKNDLPEIQEHAEDLIAVL
jgi:hypothetical protein